MYLLTTKQDGLKQTKKVKNSYIKSDLTLLGLEEKEIKQALKKKHFKKENLEITIEYKNSFPLKKYKPTIPELKKANKIYFEKGKDRFHKVTERKIYQSKKLDCYVMVERKSYQVISVRTIDNETLKLGYPVHFDELTRESRSEHTTKETFSGYIGKDVNF